MTDDKSCKEEGEGCKFQTVDKRCFGFTHREKLVAGKRLTSDYHKITFSQEQRQNEKSSF
jgi:hypothetical protein